MITFSALSLQSMLPELNFTFDTGVLCLVTDRPETEKAFFSVITGELLPSKGSVANNFKNISLCSSALPNELRAEKYLKFVCKCKKSKNIPEAASSLVSDILGKKIRNLSFFEKLKLSLATALIGSPELILISVRSEELEPSEIKRIGELIDSTREYADIIFSSDFPSLFKNHADKLLVIHENKLIGFGDTADVIALSENDGSLTARIKGDISKAYELTEQHSFELEPSEKSGIFTVNCTDTPENRKIIKTTVRKNGFAILEMKSDNESLKEIFENLVSAEEEAFAESDNEYEASEPEQSKGSALENTDTGENPPVSIRKKPSISIAFAHNDDEESED